jgi:predicted amidohydrolase YtcJ
VAVLDRDYFTVPDREIRDIRSVLTVVGGRIVHEA